MDQLAVIFDMDGVLVDSYQAHFESWRIIAEKHGKTITEQQFAQQFGRTSREIIEAYWGEGVFTDDQIKQMDDEKEAAFREILKKDFPAMPGARELIEKLRQAGFLLAVGSSGPPENIDLVLDKLGCRSCFAAVITGKDVTRGKPDPQVFLLAAERLGVPAQRCAVIEDAPAGVTAANRAGMVSIGFASTGRKPEDLAHAKLVISSLAELSPEKIRQLIEENCRHRGQ